MAIRPGGQMLHNAAPTRSQLMPLLTKYKELPTKTQLIPAALTAVVIMMLFAYSNSTTPIVFKRGENPAKWIYTSHYIVILGTFLVFLSLQFLYSLAGKAKSWLALTGAMVFTMCFLQFGGFSLVAPVFYGLAGGSATGNETLLISLWKHFVGTGFSEEFTKAIPLLLLVFFASKMTPEQVRKYGIEEPLDGILLGAASAGGFVLIETLTQYVPGALVRTWVHLAMALSHSGEPTSAGQLGKLIDLGSALVGTSPGLQLLIPRALRACFGHMAYSGYFGYFIGLAVLKPTKRWPILLVGFLTASFGHAMWDTFSGDLFQIAVAVTCYASLMAAILKARELSPNRMILGPSVLLGYSASPAPAMTLHHVPIPAPAPAPAPAAAAAPAPAAYAMAVAGHLDAGPALPPVPVQSLTLRIGNTQFSVRPGLRIFDHEVPGLQPRSPGFPVAEVISNPKDQTQLGLANHSTTAWSIVSASGNHHSIAPGQTVRIARGVRMNFGTSDGEIW